MSDPLPDVAKYPWRTLELNAVFVIPPSATNPNHAYSMVYSANKRYARYGRRFKAASNSPYGHTITRIS